MLKPVDYDERQHVGYAAGRDHGPASARFWAEVFAAQAPTRRPLSALDLGSGTGRFTTALAETFGGPVFGVEPSARMRAVAVARTTDPRVGFLAGRAEAIPLPDAACDLVLMFLSFHHVADRVAAALEIARVLRPGGRVLVRSQFADRFPDIRWHAYFPRARSIELQMFPTLADTEAAFAPAGLRRMALVSVDETFAASLAEHADRLRHRAVSTFEHMTEAEMTEGFARLDAAAAQETPPQPIVARSDVLVLAAD
jgi:ubiquinone/menaquinone biosynthesis C-methylase UbiE